MAAVEVLTAISEHSEPETADVEELRQMAPGCASRPLDELACEVVQQAVQQATKRTRAGGANAQA